VQTLYLPLLRPHTHLVLLGIPDSGIPSGGWPLLGKSITGSLIGSPSEIREMFAFATRHGVRALVERRGMGDAEGALKDLHEGRARYRYVLVNEGE
jgi:alcohol dehydrogenase (NADP+)